MKRRYLVTIALMLNLAGSNAYSYGTSSSSSHCEKPMFTEFQPAPNKYLQSFTDFSLIASANTAPNSITVSISSGNLQYDYSAKDLKISALVNGKFDVRAKLPRPIENGFARLNVTAHSKPGCEKTEGYLLRIQ